MIAEFLGLNFIKKLSGKFFEYRLNRAKKAGLQIADDVKLHGMPFWGSEPYLISIGKNVDLSGKIVFLTHDGSVHAFRQKYDNFQLIRYGRIVIHENCFIGYGAIILPGVSIGPNSVVAAGSVVVSDVPPNTVVWGNPARPLMSMDAYEQKLLEKNVDVDKELFNTDRRAALEKVFPRPW